MISDPQVLAFIAATEAAYPAETNTAGPSENRRYYDEMCAVFRGPRPDGLPVRDQQIAGVPCRIYGEDSPLFVLYLHGGGFVVGGLDSHDDICAELADACGLQVIAVDYRLAPEHVWPAPLVDAQAVWRAQSRPGIVMGDSAGGLLAAALSLSERDGNTPQGQVLIYPGLGGTGSAPSYIENAEAPLLRSNDVAAYHHLLHGTDPVTDPYAQPLQVADLHGAPPAFIVSADVDPLRDDAKGYAQRLQQAGNRVAYRNEMQLPHGYLRARRSCDRARISFQAIVAAVVRMCARA